MRPWGDLQVWPAGVADEDGDEVDRSGVWRRPRSEYQIASSYRELCSIDEARTAHLSESLTLEGRRCFISGIRGNRFHPEAYSNPRARGELWFELVPEPNNPYDPAALAVDLNGVRAGYIGRRIARHYQWLIRASNKAGMRVVTPGFVEAPTSGWIVLPTLAVIQEAVGAQSYIARLRHIWDHLPEALRSQVAADGFHLSDGTAKQLWHYRHLEPALFPTIPEVLAFSPAWDRILADVRHERNDLLAEQRNLQRTAREAEERLRRERRDKEKAARDKEIRLLYMAGHSKAEISRRVGASAETVRRLVKELPALGAAAGLNGSALKALEERLERCEKALELQEGGATRRQIARELGVEVDTAKSLLSDGRFYRDPTAYPGRLEWARRAHRDRGTNAQAKAQTKANVGVGALRGAKDERILARLHPMLLTEDRDQWTQ